MPDVPALACPDCDEPLAFAFEDAGGLGAWKRGDGYNTTPDTRHYLCFPCGRTWKQRLDGPLTSDIAGDLAFFTCRRPDCGRPLTIVGIGGAPATAELACADGHRYRIAPDEADALVLHDA